MGIAELRRDDSTAKLAVVLRGHAVSFREAAWRASSTTGDPDELTDLGADPAHTNVDGGAIAMGHPLGATGAMLLGTAVDALERRDRNVALITLCIGGGMGIATIIERV